MNSDLIRTNVINERGSIFLATENTSLSLGSHTSTLSCRRSSAPGNIQIQDSVMVGHFLINERNETMNATFNSVSVNLPGTGTFTNLTTFNHTTNALTVGDDVIRAIVVDWAAVYNYNTSGNISTRIDLDGLKECSDFPRVGLNGDIGSLGGSCAILNVTANTTIEIQIQGFGNGSVDFKTHVKEFIMDIKEINFTSPEDSPAVRTIAEINISTSNLTEIVSFNITNVDHDNANLFLKCGVSVESKNGSTLASFQITIESLLNSTTAVVNLTVDESGSKVLMIQDVFQNLPIGEYKVTALAACANADCVIEGGDIIAYLTDASTFTPNSFEVTAFDNFTSQQIIDFDVKFNGAETSDVNGTVTIVTLNNTINLTLSSDLYFNTTILGHNTSLNLNASLIPFTKIFVIDNAGNTILNFEVNFTNLANTSEMGNSASNASGVAQIPIFNATYSVIAFDINNGSVNFAQVLANLTANPGLVNHTFTALLTNSFNLIFLNEQTRELINTTTVSIEFISDVEALNFTTSNGTIFVSALVPSEIEIRYDADGFNQRSYYFRTRR